MASILVTGAHGFIGSMICRKLAAQYNVIGIDEITELFGPLPRQTVLRIALVVSSFIIFVKIRSAFNSAGQGKLWWRYVYN